MKFGLSCLNCVSGTAVMHQRNAYRIWSSPSWHDLALRVQTSLLGYEVVCPLALSMHTLIGEGPARQFHIPAENPNLKFTPSLFIPHPSKKHWSVLHKWDRLSTWHPTAASPGRWGGCFYLHQAGKEVNLDLHLVVIISNQWPTEWQEDGI